MTVTDEDRERARKLLLDAADAAELDGTQPLAFALADANTAAVAQALADERERALSSCHGAHPKMTALASGPGMVIYDGTELRWERDAQAVDGAGGAE